MLLKITLLKLQYCPNLLGKYYTWALIKKTYNIQANISMFQIYEIFFSRKKNILHRFLKLPQYNEKKRFIDWM